MCKSKGTENIRGGRGTADGSLAVLGAMLEFGVRQGVLSANSAKGVKLLKGEKRERFLSDREVAALADALAVLEDQRGINATMAAAIRLLMLSGSRKNQGLSF